MIFENIPYTNFHDLNLDWIIEVVKDFMQKYNSIMELIENGKRELIALTDEELEDLQNKYNALENLLNEWYASHSEDIENELQRAVASFGYQANTKAAQALATIPDDYAELSASVLAMKTVLNYPNSGEQFAKNYTPIISWLNNVGATYTETDGVITITLNNAALTPYRFSNTDIPVMIHANMQYLSGTVGGRIELLNNNDEVKAIISPQLAAAWGVGSKVRFNYGVSGQCELTDVFTMQVDTNLHRDYGTVIYPGNYASALPDADKAHANMIYRFGGFGDGTANIPANLPFATWDTNDRPAILFDYASNNTNLYRIQLFLVIDTGEIYKRYYNHTYNLWETWKLLSPYIIKTVAPSGGDYTSITEAILNNNDKNNVTIKVEAGTYNIISEINAHYGEGYIESLTDRWYGDNTLQNGMHLIFSPGAIVTCIYTGSNTYFRNYFSPFNAGPGGFTIEGLFIQCKGVRYCVHDERGTTGSVPTQYKNVYKNCFMIKDSENGATQQQCIGGGLGVHGVIEISNCVFDGDMRTDPQTLVSYHNSSHSEAKSWISITDCLFGHTGRMRFAHYGTSTQKTNCVVSGNKMGNPIQVAYESSSYDVPNMQLLEWNNIIS